MYPTAIHQSFMPQQTVAPVPPEADDSRMINIVRLILAVTILCISLLYPRATARQGLELYLALTGYLAYSLFLSTLAQRNTYLAHAARDWSHWLDLGWFLGLSWLSSNLDGACYGLLFFAILVAAFRWGFLTGMRVVSVAVILFTILGAFAAGADASADLLKLLLRPIYLLTLGYMLAYWGEHEVTAKRRLAFSKDVAQFANPRFGTHQTIGTMLARAHTFFAADACLLLSHHTVSESYTLRQANADDPAASARAQFITPEVARALLALPDDCAAIYNRTHRFWQQHTVGCYAFDRITGVPLSDMRQPCAVLADLLDTESLITVPLRGSGGIFCRVFLISRERSFARGDLDFLHRLVNQALPVIENVRLLGRLASESAGQERQKISRDVHDSTVQPFVGIKLGLEALSRKLSPDDALSADVAQLLELTGEAISEARLYATELQQRPEATAPVLLSAVRSQALKFTELHGIVVDVHADEPLDLQDRLAAELFQMIREGLSNIRRHTAARRAVISLRCQAAQVCLQIANDNPSLDAVPPEFIPRSIAERTAALGGQVSIVRRADGYTTVQVAIPL